MGQIGNKDEESGQTYFGCRGRMPGACGAFRGGSRILGNGGIASRCPALHTKMAAEWLREKGIDEDIIYAVMAHAEQVEPKSKLDWTLFTVDPATGLIVAAALMHPTKSLAGLDVEFLLKRFKEKRFAAGARRETIAACSNLGLSLEEFLAIVLKGMQKISDELGL